MFTANCGTLLEMTACAMTDLTDSSISKMEWQRWNRHPTYCVNWVWNSFMKYHNALVRDWREQRRGHLYPDHSELQDADSLFLRFDPSGDVPGRGGVVNVLKGAVARATTLVTGSLGLVMALLESISYTQHLSVRRISAERLGAQESGQTA